MPVSNRAWRLARAAVADLEEIWLHTLKQWSADQADRYHNEIMQMISDLAADRRRGRNIEIDARSYLYHPCGSHNIFFREEKARIVIVRILHARMDFKRHL